MFIPRPNGPVCRRVLCVLCTKCTLHSNHRLTRVIFQHTKWLPPGAAILSLHTLASPSGRNVKYDEEHLTGKKILTCSFYLYRFRKHVSYGFPIINFCNPGVHYETPYISEIWMNRETECDYTVDMRNCCQIKCIWGICKGHKRKESYLYTLDRNLAGSWRNPDSSEEDWISCRQNLFRYFCCGIQRCLWVSDN
jgi:hypothetical protein